MFNFRFPLAGRDPRLRATGINRYASLRNGLVAAFVTQDGLRWVDLAPRFRGHTHWGTTDNSSGDLVADRIQDVNGFDMVATDFSGDATNDRIDLGSIDAGHKLNLSGYTQLTIAAWVRVDSVTGFPRIFDKSNGAGGTNGWAFYIGHFSGDGYLVLAIDNTTALRSNTSVGTGVKHLAMAWHKDVPAGNLVVIDGAAVAQARTSATIPSTTTNAAIGNWNHATDRMFNGAIGSVTIWNRSLSLAEINYHRRLGSRLDMYATAVDELPHWTLQGAGGGVARSSPMPVLNM